MEKLQGYNKKKTRIYFKEKIILQTKLKKTSKKKYSIHKPKFLNVRNHIMNGGNTSRRF
jgi:hypothetical protein